MSEVYCPECKTLIRLRNGDITCVEAARDVNFRADCAECGATLNVWARISSVERL